MTVPGSSGTAGMGNYRFFTSTGSNNETLEDILGAAYRFKGIISPTTVGVAAAARYLSGSSFKGKVQLTGLGTPNQMKAFVRDGTVKAFALWNPADLGYLAAYAGGSLASGMITGKEATSSRRASSASLPSARTPPCCSATRSRFNPSNVDQFNF